MLRAAAGFQDPPVPSADRGCPQRLHRSRRVTRPDQGKSTKANFSLNDLELDAVFLSCLFTWFTGGFYQTKENARKRVTLARFPFTCAIAIRLIYSVSLYLSLSRGGFLPRPKTSVFECFRATCQERTPSRTRKPQICVFHCVTTANTHTRKEVIIAKRWLPLEVFVIIHIFDIQNMIFEFRNVSLFHERSFTTCVTISDICQKSVTLSCNFAQIPTFRNPVVCATRMARQQTSASCQIWPKINRTNRSFPQSLGDDLIDARIPPPVPYGCPVPTNPSCDLTPPTGEIRYQSSPINRARAYFATVWTLGPGTINPHPGQQKKKILCLSVSAIA